VDGVKQRLSFSIRDELARRITLGRIPAGGRLPPEPQLAVELGVSRPTLREALRSLEEDGFVTRTRGAGTYVAHQPRLRNNLDVNFGVTEAIRAAGMVPGTAFSKIHTAAASGDEAEALDLAEGDTVVTIERIRTADGRPVVWSRDVAPATLLPVGSLRRLGSGSIYDALAARGISVQRGVVTLEPLSADSTLAKTLAIGPGSQVLYLRQVDYDPEGEPVLLSHEYHVADAFEFSVIRRGLGRGSE